MLKIKISTLRTLNKDLGNDALEYILNDAIFEDDYETLLESIPKVAQIAVLQELEQQFVEAVRNRIDYIRK